MDEIKITKRSIIAFDTDYVKIIIINNKTQKRVNITSSVSRIGNDGFTLFIDPPKEVKRSPAIRQAEALEIIAKSLDEKPGNALLKQIHEQLHYIYTEIDVRNTFEFQRVLEICGNLNTIISNYLRDRKLI